MLARQQDLAPVRVTGASYGARSDTMQTFLPYADFLESASCLDRMRLGKQRVECKQIYNALTIPGSGWRYHPAVRMWDGYEQAVACYGRICCEEWIRQGYRDSLWEWFCRRGLLRPAYPDWFGRPDFHRSHRSNLVRKMPDHYRRFFPSVPDDLPYVWPVRE